VARRRRSGVGERTVASGHAPTPIRISRRTCTVLVALGFVVFVLIMWYSPTVPIVLLGGFAVALVLSFPVRWLSHIMPRWLAMLVTFLVDNGRAQPRHRLDSSASARTRPMTPAPAPDNALARVFDRP
jgi:hypothetical protein